MNLASVELSRGLGVQVHLERCKCVSHDFELMVRSGPVYAVGLRRMVV